MKEKERKRRRLPYTLYSILLAAVLVVGASVFGGAITLSNTDGYLNVSSCVNVTNGNCTINYNLSRYSSDVRDGILSSTDWIRFNSTTNISNGTQGPAGTNGTNGINGTNASVTTGDNYINVQAGIITANTTTFDSRYILLNNIPNNFTNITVNDKILLIDTTDSTTPPEAGRMNLYTKNISGRMMLKGVGPSGLDYPYQPSFFQNNIVMFGAGGSTVVGILGTTVTSVGTVSHPTNNITTPYAANFRSATTGSLTSGTGTVNAQFYRGNGGAGQASGWFMNARVVLPDTDYRNSTVFVGLTSGTMAASVSNANPAGTGAGFQYQFNVSSNWTFMTDDGTTLTRQDTNIPFTPNGKTTDFYMFCSPGCNSISWRIDDVLAGLTSSGSKNTNLPTATTALRAGVQQLNSETIARNIRLARMYMETDR